MMNDQTFGKKITNWQGSSIPSKKKIEGIYCKLEILDIEKHSEELFNSFSKDTGNIDWKYLPYGGFQTLNEFKNWLIKNCLDNDPLFYTIIDKHNNYAVGMASYLRIEPSMGCIEVGHIHFSPSMQKKIIGTEAMYLMMCYVFDDLGYRRYEWKCNALNKHSCEAAMRLGFTLEGIFKQHMVVKGRNRDTAWYAIIDEDWKKIKCNFEQWLDKNNFDDEGRQKISLRFLTSKN